MALRGNTAIKFACQRCGNCCVTHGRCGRVYVSRLERRALAAFLKIPTRSFTSRYCVKADGFFILRDRGRDCVFLEQQRCRVYAVRPGQCMTWPFWPENLRGGNWRAGMKTVCPGTRRGRRLAPGEVARRVQAERDREATIWSW